MNMIEIMIETELKEELVDITLLIENAVKKLGVIDGNAVIFCPHTTAGLTINENADPDVKADILTALSSLEFEKLPFKHFEGNSPAHVKAGLMGHSLNIMIQNGKLMLGRWQGIFFCEFDGPRTRKVFLNIL